MEEEKAVTTYKDYNDYLKSDVWRVFRLAAIERAGGRCQLCYSNQRLQVHHRRYVEWGKENPVDLTVLCSRCHRLVTYKIQGKKFRGKRHKKKGHKHPIHNVPNWKVKQAESSQKELRERLRTIRSIHEGRGGHL